MLPVLNNTRNAQDIRKKWKGLVPFCLSAVWKWGPGDRIPCARRLGLWPREHSPHTGLTAGKHGLVAGFRYPLPTSSQRSMHQSSLSTNTMDKVTCSLKTINPLTSFPHNIRNHLPSDRNSLSNTFQPPRCLRDDALPIPAASGVQHFEPGGKRPAIVPCGSFRLRRKPK